MNSVNLIGRLTRDPEVTVVGDGLTIAKLSLAVNRRFKKEGQPDADFINIVAFGKTGEFAGKYFNKGLQVGVTGRIQTGSYEKEDGTKVYTTDVVAENVYFADKKQEASTTAPAGDNFSDDDIPF